MFFRLPPQSLHPGAVGTTGPALNLFTPYTYFPYFPYLPLKKVVVGVSRVYIFLIHCSDTKKLPFSKDSFLKMCFTITTVDYNYNSLHKTTCFIGKSSFPVGKCDFCSKGAVGGLKSLEFP